MKTNHALVDFLSLAGFQPQGERWVPIPRTPTSTSTQIPVPASSPTTSSLREPAANAATSDAVVPHHDAECLGGEITLRVPWISTPLFDCWLEPRLVWWSSELVERGTVSVVSSRIARAWDEQPEWFAGWRAIGRELRETGERLLLVKSTSTARFGQHVAERLGVPYVEVTVASDKLTLAGWLRSLRASATTTTTATVTTATVTTATTPADSAQPSRSALQLRCEISPVLPPELSASLTWLLPESIRGAEQSLPDRALPVADRALVLLGQRLLTLTVRPGGQVERLLQARERQREFWHGWTPPPAHGGDAGHVPSINSPAVISPAVISPAVTSTTAASSAALAVSVNNASKYDSGALVSWLTIEQVPQDPLLCHCTRRHDGRWEDQSEEEYFDELLWERPAKDRSALAVLSRILTTNRLAASSLAIRGGYRVIGFTARKLADLSAARVYQRHRRRWDFEPYGLAIRQDWLQQRGARPVEYGDDRDWQRLAEPQRPFFQPRGERVAATTRTAAATTPLATPVPTPAPTAAPTTSARWTGEQEWRLIGDLDLRELPAEAAYVLVGDVSDVNRLPGNLRWPVVVLKSSGRLLSQ
ncbi:MAG: hypothetical protein ACKOBW_01950 [Planctomycetota bacterium]